MVLSSRKANPDGTVPPCNGEFCELKDFSSDHQIEGGQSDPVQIILREHVQTQLLTNHHSVIEFTKTGFFHGVIV